MTQNLTTGGFSEATFSISYLHPYVLAVVQQLEKDFLVSGHCQQF